MVMLDGEEYLSGDEAAALMGVKRETLYAYVSRGMLKSYRQGIKRQRLYRRSEVEALVRLAPSAEDADARARAPEVPLAESWIRE
ncbi:MAG TPA: helix-turn-helix domain-containing protein [Methylomirabilota bacterium]|nr:helix-turn-helix domain-containing protein [Methylomirabilota bacterium]